MKKILYLLFVATMINIQGIMAQEKGRKGRFPAGNDIPHRRTEHRIRQVLHRQQLSGSHIQGTDTVQQCHFRAGLPQQLAHSPCHQRRRADAGLRSRKGLVSGGRQACRADASG